MSAGPTFERLLQRDRTITLMGLAALCLLAWLYTVTGAGLGTSVRAMTTLALFPHEQANDMSHMYASDWSVATWLLAALAILVLLEKALSAGKWVGRVAGVVLLGWGVATLLV